METVITLVGFEGVYEKGENLKAALAAVNGCEELLLMHLNGV